MPPFHIESYGWWNSTFLLVVTSQLIWAWEVSWEDNLLKKSYSFKSESVLSSSIDMSEWSWVYFNQWVTQEKVFLLWFKLSIEVIEVCCYLFYLRKYKKSTSSMWKPVNNILPKTWERNVITALQPPYITIWKKRKRKEDSRLWPNRFSQNAKVRLCQMSMWKPSKTSVDYLNWKQSRVVQIIFDLEAVKGCSNYFWLNGYNKNPNKRTTIFRAQAGKGS